MKELTELLISIVKTRLEKEQEASISDETINLLQILVQLGVYL